MRVLRSIASSLVLATLACAGVVVTNDGQRVEGELKKTPDGWRVTLPDGSTKDVASANVKVIELTSSGGGSQMERLQSLRRSVEASEDVPKIIERYRRFIEQAKEKPVIDEALADLNTWQDRQTRGLVKTGKRWMTPAEKKDLAIAIIGRADEARMLIKAAQTRDAQAAVDAILEDDPDNLSALYLQGVLLQKQEKYPEARKSFETVRTAIPDHAPTLHNLAVLSFKQKQWGPACTLLDQALAAAPNVQPLVDAAAELLNALPDDQKKSASAQKLAKRFAEQDQALQKVMLDKQMYRWGAKWVDKSTNDNLIEADRGVKKRLDELQGDFDLTQGRIERNEVEITQNERTLREIEGRSYVRTGDGSYVRVPYPPAYYDIQRDINRLRSERQEMVLRLDSLRDAAKRAQAELPVPKYSGVVSAIGEDGVPIVVPEGVDLSTARPKPPATQPVPQSPAPPPIIRIGPSNDAQ